MGLSGCLEEKINVIRPLENFLSDFEKKVSAFFEPKVLVNGEKSSAILFSLNFSVEKSNSVRAGGKKGPFPPIRLF